MYIKAFSFIQHIKGKKNTLYYYNNIFFNLALTSGVLYLTFALIVFIMYGLISLYAHAIVNIPLQNATN